MRPHFVRARRLLAWIQSLICVGQTGAQRFQHPRLHFHRGLGDLDTANRSLRIVADGKLEWPMLAIHSHEEQHAGDLVLAFAEVECDDSVGWLPSDSIV